MTVLITGSSRGIGRAIAMAFNKSSNNIVINGISNKHALDETLSQLRQTNDNVMGITADVSDYNAVKNMFEQINNRFGGVDVLINNAGISHIGLFDEMTPIEWNRLIDVNIKSVFNCCHCAIDHMLKNKNGVIINISSIWGVSGASCEAVYSATKGAINAFTKALAKELAPSGIRVNAIACGAIDTSMNDCFDDEEKEDLISRIPAMRFGTPEEIADLCTFLAEPKSKYIIGQTITVDGGFL